MELNQHWKLRHIDDVYAVMCMFMCRTNVLFCNDACFQDTANRMVISGIITYDDFSLEVNCSENYCYDNTAQETALVQEPFYTGTCPDSEEPCLPLLPVKKEPLQV